MNTKILHILLVLVAMQSTIAVADLHQFHPLNQEHSQLDSQQYSDTSQSDQSSDISLIKSKISYDCQHCCHCHGFVQFYIDDFSNKVIAIAEPKMINRNFSRFYSHVISPDLRPPII